MKHSTNLCAQHNRRGRQLHWLLVCLGLSLFGLGCGQSGTAEERIRAALDAMQTAAESRQMGGFIKHISDDYYDAEARSRQDIRALARLQFLRHRELHVYKIIKDITVDAQQAKVVVLVATAGEPIDSTNLASLRAELSRFELDLVEQGNEWKVTAAKWRRVQAADFLR